MNEYGKIINSSIDIMQRLREYFDDLMNNEKTNYVDAENEIIQIALTSTNNIKIEEVIDTLKILKLDRTAGYDQIKTR